MSDLARSIESINYIAAQIPMLEKSDLAPMMDILTRLESLAGEAAFPAAFKTAADRGAKLTQHIIMAETPFDAGLKKLSECVAKLSAALDEMALKNPVKAEEKHPSAKTGAKSGKRKAADESQLPLTETRTPVETSRPAADPMPDDVRDLLVKFATQLQIGLEDFEAYVLELEKENPRARGAIRRQLHTWKGEFGVLDMGEYSALIHELEQGVEDGRVATDNLLRFKDFLSSRIELFGKGQVPAIATEERVALVGTRAASSSETSSSVPSRAPSGAVPGQAEPSALPAASPGLFVVDPSLVADFVTESREHIHNAETLLLELETQPANPDNLNSIFRACHTVKGVAGFLGLTDVAALSHSMENLMDMARKGDLALGPEHIDLLLESMDVLKEFVTVVERSLSGEAYRIPEKFADVMKRLSLPHSTVVEKPVEPAASPERKVGEILVENGGISQSDVTEALRLQAEGDERRIGEILIEDKDVPVRQVAQALASQNAARKTGGVEESVRVPVSRLDQLIDAIGEAVIAQSMVGADPTIRAAHSPELDRKITQTAMMMRQVQELSMSLRMVSLKATFQKMARLVRDLAKKVGKDVELVLEGEDTELDKSVVENIGDPLIHMIRNAVDHGVETPQERIDAGKSVKSTVSLRAKHKAGNVMIEIQDDGKGLDRAAILRKAVEKGLAQDGQHYDDHEIFQFIFLPGFSTAKVVTDVSGRGVGMDVVRKNIQALRGSCDIQSTEGKGTLFTIRLPLTLAIINGMIVRLGEERYIVPTLSILESIRPTAEQVQGVVGKGEMLKVRGELMRFVRLTEILHGRNGRKSPEGGIAMVVEDVIGRKIALFVDEILDQQQVVIKSIGGGMGQVPGITGGAIMSDGNVSLILDVAGIARMSAE
jgi:two-component system chemotaxis sensor kinase CheA